MLEKRIHKGNPDVQRLTFGIAAAVILLGAASAVQAGWVWRDGKWHYEESEELPPTAPEPRETPREPVQPEPDMPKAEPPESEPAERPATPEPPEPPTETETPGELPDAQKPARPPEEKPSWWDRAKWWEKPPPAGGDKPRFNEAHNAYRAGEYRTAEKAFDDLIKDYPESPYREEAMWLRAEALFARQRYYKAYEQYEDLIEQYAGSRHYQDALRKEIEIAELYLGPVRRRVLGIPMMSGEAEAIEILRRVWEHQPAGDLADDVVLRIADHYWSKDKWADAEAYYDKYCKEYPNGEAIRHAELRRARCSIQQCKGPRYCTTSLKLAEDRLRQFQTKYPDEAARRDVPAMLDRLRNLQAQSLYEIAARYRRAGHPCAAAFYAERLRSRYPDSPWSRKADDFLAPTLVPEPTTPEAGQEEDPS